jgi:hypothetical protein
MLSTVIQEAVLLPISGRTGIAVEESWIRLTIVILLHVEI